MMDISMLAIQLKYARDMAETYHELAGDRYQGHPYTLHLDAVRSVAFEFGVVDADILIATLLHDIIEDTAATKADVYTEFGVRVADLVDAVSDPPGKNRKERKAASYPRIVAVPGAVVVKLADRIANVRSCWRVAQADKQNKSRLGMYGKEYPGFRKALRSPDTSTMDTVELAMWDELDRLLAWKP